MEDKYMQPTFRAGGFAFPSFFFNSAESDGEKDDDANEAGL
jgi:hypothetical protein